MSTVNQIDGWPLWGGGDVLGGHRSAFVNRPALNARFSREDGTDVPLGHVLRPRWRGRVHALALTVIAPAVLMLVASADGTVGKRIGVGVYAVGLCSMLLVSATYHRWVHGMRARCAWRRADHAMIFAGMAGSATPIVMSAMPGVTGLVLLVAVWSAAIIGAGCKLGRWCRGDRVGSVMYAVTIALGGLAVPALWLRQGPGPALLVVAGGAIYFAGAVCFARNWPTLRPTVFSFHEVWHVFTVVGAGLHLAAIWILAT
jgi:hemolysin III